MLRTLTFLSVAGLLSFGCNASSGSDAGTPSDAGMLDDAGVPRDAGQPDAGDVFRVQLSGTFAEGFDVKSAVVLWKADENGAVGHQAVGALLTELAPDDACDYANQATTPVRRAFYLAIENADAGLSNGAYEVPLTNLQGGSVGAYVLTGNLSSPHATDADGGITLQQIAYPTPILGGSVVVGGSVDLSFSVNLFTNDGGVGTMAGTIHAVGCNPATPGPAPF